MDTNNDAQRLGHILQSLDFWILGALYEQPQMYDEPSAFNIKHFHQDTALDREIARGALRSARDRGLLRFVRGLMTEDGDLMGAGYQITPAGKIRYLQLAKALGLVPEPDLVMVR